MYGVVSQVVSNNKCDVAGTIVLVAVGWKML